MSSLCLDVTQNIKAAEMDLYAVFNRYSADFTATSGGVVAPAEIDDRWAVAAGGRNVLLRHPLQFAIGGERPNPGRLSFLRRISGLAWAKRG